MNTLTIAVVTENYDSENPGKVRVLLPGFSEEGNTPTWIPIMSTYAGKNYGSYWMPEVGESVIVGFLDGDPCSGIVLGSYWNQKNTLPEETHNENNEIKTLVTKSGHKVVFNDKDNGSVTVTTASGMSVEMDDEKKSVTITGHEGKCQVSMVEDKMEITSETELSIKSKTINIEGEKVSVSGKPIEIKSDTDLKIEGKTIKQKGTTTTIESTSLALKGSDVKAESSGILTLKGSLTKIN